jgi:homospermidine synthase
MNTWVRSWVPSGEITGMVIRHGESYSLSRFLTVSEEGRVAYRPTVHYAYCPCDSAVNSMHELEMRQFVPQERRRILSKEIIKGGDELGCLLMGHDFKAWWIGSILDIQNSRKWLPEQNTTTLQVAISVVAACLWMIDHPSEGFCLPEDLDHQEILKISKPYLGKFVSTPIDWSPLHKKNAHLDYGCHPIHSDNEWQFGSFLLSPMETPAIQPVVQAF